MLYEVITGSKIQNPIPVDAHGTVLRIDLRWYIWDATIWNRILTEEVGFAPQDIIFDPVITSYSIHYTKLYEMRIFFTPSSMATLIKAKSSSKLRIFSLGTQEKGFSGMQY